MSTPHQEYFQGLLTRRAIGSPCDCSIGCDHGFEVPAGQDEELYRVESLPRLDERIPAALSLWSERSALRSGGVTAIGARARIRARIATTAA